MIASDTTAVTVAVVTASNADFFNVSHYCFC